MTEPPESARFVEVHQASSEISAHLIKLRLDEEGIPCVIFGDDTVGLFAQSMMPRIMVPRDVAETRGDEIRAIITSIDGGREPTPRAPYLIRLPRGCLIMFPLVLALTFGVPSVASLVLGWPWGRAGAAIGLVVSALLGWLGVAMLLRDRKQRPDEEAARDEEEE